MKLSEVFKGVLVNTILSADGNRYASDFVCVSLWVTTKKGKTVANYSVSQKNVTGIIEQCRRALMSCKYNQSKHNVSITID